MNVLGGLNWLDVVLLLLLVAGLVIGYTQGLLRQVIALAALYIGAVLGAQYFTLVGNGLRLVFVGIPPRFLNALGFFIILVFVTALVNWLAYDAYRSTKLTLFPIFDHLGGSVGGLITAFATLSLCLPVIMFATSEAWPWGEPNRMDIVAALTSSQMVILFDSLKPALLNALGPWLPGGLPSIFNL